MKSIRQFLAAGLVLVIALFAWPQAEAFLSAPGTGTVGYVRGMEQPALDLDFTQSLDSRITFTRASNAMFFPSDGVLQYAPHQLLENANLSDNSDGSASGWAEDDTGVAKTYVALGDGAFSFQSTASNENGGIFNPTTVLAGTTYTIGAFISNSSITAGNGIIVGATGTSGSNGDITDADWDALGGTAGWYAVGITMGAADTLAGFAIGAGAKGLATGTALLSRPFIVKGLLPGVGVNVPARLGGDPDGEPLGEWIGTDDGDEPKHDFARVKAHTFDGTNWINRGFLIEEARTNLCLQSEDFLTTWVLTNFATRTANTTVAPDGNTTADTLIDASSSGQSALSQSITVTDDALDHALSLYVLKDTDETRFPEILLRYAGGTGVDYRLRVNTKTGAVDTSIDAAPTISGSIDAEDYWRFFIVGPNNNTGNTTLSVFISPAKAATINGAAANAVEGSIIGWGAHVEKASFPLSHIPTTLASVARSTDVATMNSFATGILNANAGTFYTRSMREHITTGTNARIFRVEDESGTGDTPVISVFGRTTVASFRVNLDASAGNDVLLTLSTEVAGQEHQIAFAYAQDDVAATLDAGTVITDSTFDITTGYDEFHIGSNEGTAEHYNGFIAEILYWDRDLSDGRLQDKTVPFSCINPTTPITTGILLENCGLFVLEGGDFILQE